MLFNKQLDKVHRVCPSCGHHFRISAAARIELLLDHGSFDELDAGLVSLDPLGFIDLKSYPDRVAAAQVATGLRDAAIWGTGAIEGRRVAICVMDFGFMGGSMGSVVGEKVTRAAELALAERIPLVVVSASGGARMQEGTLALMQLAKTVAALERLRAGGVPYVSVMSDPTTGGVFASYAVLGDVNLAEPNALIGFAGARVSAGTIAQELPPGFQRSEFLFEHGFVDRIVHRSEVRAELAVLLRFLVPASLTAAPVPETNGVPAFRPLSFLSALAERVLPEAPVETNGLPHEPGERAPSTTPGGSVQGGQALRRRRGPGVGGAERAASRQPSSPEGERGTEQQAGQGAGSNEVAPGQQEGAPGALDAPGQLAPAGRLPDDRGERGGGDGGEETGRG
jgi:acetyl-CoA carboxylase carboxyl transferase subunit beta